MSESLLEELAVAIEGNDADQVESLIQSGSIDVNARLPRALNPPPLVLAASQRPTHVRILELLLNAGARIDDVDDNGKTACHLAVLRQAEVLQALLSHLPNLALLDWAGQSALEIALTLKCDQSAVALIAAGASLDDVISADLCRLAAYSVSAVELLISRGIVISELRGDSGETPLHHAVMSESPCSLALLHKLIACGVDLHALTTDLNHYSCASLAIGQHRADALCVLLQAGANVHEEQFGYQLLQYSVIIKSYECTLVLLAAGADVTARDGGGTTACIEAAPTRKQKDEDVLRVMHALLAGGSDLDAANNRGNTARQVFGKRLLSMIDAEQVEAARRRIAKMRLDFVRTRALEVCIGLQPLELDALQMCEILQFACGPLARLIAFHHWWKIATTVKHFGDQ